MHAVVLSFPGHFFQTLISLKSIIRWYEIERLTLILDDIDKASWNDYADDFRLNVAKVIPQVDFDILLTSQIDKLSRVIAGWWRQQLIKLTIDTLVAGDCWFVVDGDVIFESRCQIENVIPVSVRPDCWNSVMSKLSINYVTRLLGSKPGYLEYNNQYAPTNPVPFRLLDRSILQGLRNHVTGRFRKDFVELHIQWFNNQTIVAYEPDPIHMNMTEWELIEIYRQDFTDDDFPLIDIGGGYPLLHDVSKEHNQYGVYRHGYTRDTKIAKDWFANQMPIDDDLWQKALRWQAHRDKITAS